MNAPEPRLEIPFLQSRPTLQFAWDNSSILLLKECPRKYQYAILEGWRPKHQAPPLYFGGLFHKCLEIYDALRAQGTDHDAAQLQAVIAAMRRTAAYEPVLVRDPEGDMELVDQESGEVVKASIRERCVLWISDDPNRSRRSLVRSIIWYTEHFKHDALRTFTFPDGTPAVELSFQFALPMSTPEGDPYLYVGHIDKIAEMAGQLWNVERKHTKNTLSSSYFANYSPNSQVSGYSFAGKVVLSRPVSGTIVDATQVAVDFNRHMRHIASRNQDQLDEWLMNTCHWIRLAEHFSEIDYWPMNEESCHKYSGCQFREVCSKSPGSRAGWLEAKFVRNPWNPLKARTPGEE